MQLSNLDTLHLEDIQNPQHPSVFFNNKEYKILIYRLFDDKEDELSVKSHSYIIDSDKDIYRYDKVTKKLFHIESYDSFYKMIDHLVDKCMDKVESHIKAIEDLEETIYDNKDVIHMWFTLKKEMLRMERILTQAIKTHAEFIKNSNIIKSNPDLLNGFQDIEEHLNRTYRNCSVNISKLDNIYSLYTTIINDKMNKTIFSLTVISAIFLPINLIVGFFGMNTEGLFFAGNPNGTILVTAIMASILVSFGIVFFLKRKSFY